MNLTLLKTKEISAKDALLSAVLDLQRAHVISASFDARLLLEHVLGVSREELLMDMNITLSEEQEVRYQELVSMRAARRPMAHILGNREFWGAKFAVSAATLDPRPDSETLVEAVLERVADRTSTLRLLDLGTGTGCLMLTLLRELPGATGVAVDISPDALEVARANAKELGLSDRVTFITSNWCEKIEGDFHIVISNPPYIPTSDIETLEPEVREYEPRLALDGGKDGMTCYRKILSALPKILKKNGFAVFELGVGQQRPFEEVASECGMKLTAVKKDLGGIPRAAIVNPLI